MTTILYYVTFVTKLSVCAIRFYKITLYKCKVVFKKVKLIMSISTALLEVCVPSGIFCYRNIKKAENGEPQRGTVAFAQGAKIVQAVANYNETTAKTADSAMSVFNEYAKKSKFVDYTGKAVKWATKNVNPLICASSVVKTAMAEDKVGTGINETGALAAMFAGEGLMKLHLDKAINAENVSKIAKQADKVNWLKPLAKFMNKSGNNSKIAAIVKGITFVCGSMASYSIGHDLAEKYSDRIKANLGLETPKINQKA